MAAIFETGDGFSIESANLRLMFRWSGDRWAHSLELGGDLPPRVLASSLEDTSPDPARVLSPAYQQLQHQQAPGAPEALQALLVGQSGPHHFSAVFTVREAPGGIVSVEVEVADRCRGEVASAASTYVVPLSSSDLQDAGPSAVSWGLGPAPSGVLSLSADPPARLDLRDAGHRASHVQASARIVPGQPTITWAYSWRLHLSP